MKGMTLFGFLLAVVCVWLIATSSASARPGFFRCAQVFTAGTGTYPNNNCQTPGGTKEFVWAELGGAVNSEYECVKTKEPAEAAFKDALCAEPIAPKMYQKVINVPGGEPFNSVSGSRIITDGTSRMVCARDTNRGIIHNGRVVALMVNYFGCQEIIGSESCPVNSPGAKSEEVKTGTLKGTLGEVAKSEAESGVGLLLEPETSKVLEKLESTKCSPATTVSGSIAGALTPVNTLKTSTKLVFTSTSKQAIGLITVETEAGKTTKVKPALEVFGASAREESTDTIEFEEGIEIT